MTDMETEPRSGTPWHLWVVGGLSLLWNGFGCFDYIMTLTRNQAYLSGYPEEMLTYWLAMPWWMWTIWAIGVLGGLAGSIALLMRKSLALPLFAASGAAAVISMGISAMDADAPRMEGAEVFTAVIILIALALIAYAFWMSRRGVLK